MQSRRKLRRSFAAFLARQDLFDLIADGVRDGEVNLLDDRRVVAGRDQQMVAERAERRALAAGESDGDEPMLPRGRERGENVRRAARSGKGEQRVAAPGKTRDLSRKY